MDFFKLIIHYVPKYKWYLLIYILLLVLTALLSVFSFAAIIPILQILFGISEANLKYISLSSCDSFSNMLEVLKNDVFYYLQEQILAQGSGRVLFLLVLFIITTSLLSNLTSYFGYYFRIPIRTGISRDIRMDLYKKVTKIPVGFFTKDNKGDFMSRMTSDAEEVEYGIASAIDMLIENPIPIIVYLITLFGISWKLTSFAVILLVICSAIILWVGLKMKDIALKGQSQRGKILSWFEETLSALRIIKSYNNEQQMISSFSKLNEDTRNTFNHLNRQYSLAFPLADFLATSIIAVMLWFGGRHLLNGNLSLGPSEFIYFLIIFHSIISPTRSMLKAFYAIRKAMASVDRIGKILKIEIPIQETQKPISVDSIITDFNETPIIEYKNVYFGYQQDNPILVNVNLSITKGKTIAIVGKTGSGKTTMAELLPRFIDPDAGMILLYGKNIKNYSLTDLRNSISYVNQEPILFNDTIYNNIAFGKMDATIEQIEITARLANIHDYIMSTPNGYQTKIGDHGSRLSGGQCQCICIARAMLKDAPILILDEATSAIDTDSEKSIIQQIRDFDKSKTIIIISHHIDNIIDYVDECYQIKDGNINKIDRTFWRSI